MSTTTVILLVAGYFAFVAFVLALLSVAHRADEAARKQARLCALRGPAPSGRSWRSFSRFGAGPRRG